MAYVEVTLLILSTPRGESFDRDTAGLPVSEEPVNVLDFINEYALAVQAFATIALVLLTFVLAWATVWLALESRKARKGAIRPRVSAKLKVDGETGQFIRLIVASIGHGPALNLNIGLEGDEKDFANHKMEFFGGVSGTIKFLSPGETEDYFLGIAERLFADPPMQPFSIVLEYTDVYGKSYVNRVEMNVKQFEGTHWFSFSASWRQMRSVEKIEGMVGRIVKIWKKLGVVLGEDRKL